MDILGKFNCKVQVQESSSSAK